MTLNDFLTDRSTGSWADEMEDLPSAPAAAFSDYGDHEDRQKGSFGDRRPGFPDRRTYSRDSRYESRESPRESRYPPRIPQELPTSPPYTAHLGNLPFDLTEEQVKQFFSESKILTTRIIRDKESSRSMGFGYVEFENLESLTKALQLSGENLGKRAVRISVAEPPREREDRTAGEWRRNVPRESQAPSPRSERFSGSDKFGKEDRWSERGGFRDRGDRSDRGERDRGDRMDRSTERNDRLERKGDTEWRGGGFNNSRSSSFRERRSEERFGNNQNSVRKYDTRSSSESKAENSNNIRAVATDTGTSPPMRKKLELKPRSSTVIPNETVTPVTPVTPRSSKPNPFGEAKPIDTDEALRRVEERRKQKEKEQKEKEIETATSKNGDDATVSTENGEAE